jgi:hypothetical protein
MGPAQSKCTTAELAADHMRIEHRLISFFSQSIYHLALWTSRPLTSLRQSYLVDHTDLQRQSKTNSIWSLDLHRVTGAVHFVRTRSWHDTLPQIRVCENLSSRLSHLFNIVPPPSRSLTFERARTCHVASDICSTPFRHPAITYRPGQLAGTPSVRLLPALHAPRELLQHDAPGRRLEVQELLAGGAAQVRHRQEDPFCLHVREGLHEENATQDRIFQIGRSPRER